jgi:bacteriochlorophyll 4-vinyl reductase
MPQMTQKNERVERDAMVITNDYVLVNALMRQALMAVEEVMGKNGLAAVLHTSNLDQYIDALPPNNLKPAVSGTDYAGLNRAIEDFYGRGGRGILQRIGKASFEYGLREQSALMGLAGIALRVLPHKQQVHMVLNSIASSLMKTNSLDRIEVKVAPGCIAYIAHSCSICHGRQSDKPLCYLYLGTLSAAVRWATGQDYPVRETECIACGAEACRFEVVL